MFRATDTIDGADVVILDELEGEQRDTLRQRGRDKKLLCPHCQAAVLVKAGKYVAHHFAHWARSECPASVEKPEVLLARAVLYRWLKTKFPSGVTVEKIANGVGVDRPLDCWVEMPNGNQLAYWIVSGRVALELRERLPRRFAEAGIALTWLFVSSRMRRSAGATVEPGMLDLTATERECGQPSRFDAVYADWPNPRLFTVRYLDPRQSTLYTFRAMQRIREPNRYAGSEIVTPMEEMLVLPSTGELVHPGEFEKLLIHEAIEREMKEDAEQRYEEQLTERAANLEAWRKARAERLAKQAIAEPPTSPTSTNWLSDKWEATCVFCGKTTRRWHRSLRGPAAKCVCSQCRSKDDGRSLAP